MAGSNVRRVVAGASPMAADRAEETARRGIHDVLDDDVAEVLQKTFFSPEVPIERSTSEAVRPGPRKARPQDKPDHYKVICISFYTEDLEHLDGVVRELKRRGNTKANRSAVLRAAMRQLDLAKVPRGL